MWIRCILLHFVLATVSANQPRIITQPENLRVPLNSTVRLSCRVTVLPGLIVNWIKSRFGLGHTDRKIRAFNPRYSLPDNTVEGQYDLQIRNVRLFDDGKYRCQANVRGGNPTLSRLATLYVLVPGSAPVLRQIMPRVTQKKVDMTRRAWVKDGKSISLECVSKLGRPGATLEWKIDGETVYPNHQENGRFMVGTISGYVREREERHKRPKRVTKISRFTATVTKLHNDKMITCMASNEGYDRFPPPPASTRLTVRYKPVVLIQIFPHRPDNTYEENEEIKISCDAEGRPSDFHWQWEMIRLRRKVDIKGIRESWYRFRVKRTMHDSTFICSAFNFDKGSARVKIRVKYPPTFITPGPVLFSATIGGEVTMSCGVDSNPKPSIRWYKYRHKTVIDKGWQLKRRQISQDDFGPYLCVASAGDYSPIRKTVYLEMKGPPKIKPNSVSYGIRGRTGKVLCYITSVPKPKSKDIHWFRNGEKIAPQGRYSIKVEEFLRGVKAKLYITRLSASDYGNYNCSVFNSIGHVSEVIKLLPQETLSVAFISGAAIAVTLTLVVVIIILCLCRKNNTRRRLYKQAHRQCKNGGGADGIVGKLATDEQEMVFRPTATVGVSQAPILEAPWRGKEMAIPVTLGQGLTRFDVDERSVLRNGSVLRYKGIDLSPQPAAMQATIMEEEEAYKEDSARSYDSGYSPGPAFNIFNAPISCPSSVAFSQHGLLMPYLPQHLIPGLRADCSMPTGGGVVSCHSTNV